jgi:hypothetical protein
MLDKLDACFMRGITAADLAFVKDCIEERHSGEPDGTALAYIARHEHRISGRRAATLYSLASDQYQVAEEADLNKAVRLLQCTIVLTMKELLAGREHKSVAKARLREIYWETRNAGVYRGELETAISKAVNIAGVPAGSKLLQVIVDMRRTEEDAAWCKRVARAYQRYVINDKRRAVGAPAVRGAWIQFAEEILEAHEAWVFVVGEMASWFDRLYHLVKEIAPPIGIHPAVLFNVYLQAIRQ